MNLKVKDRLMLLNILPKESNFITLKIVRQLENELSFSEDEIKKLEFKTSQDKEKLNTTWNAQKDEGKEVEIGDKAMDIIVESLKRLDKEKKLTFEHYDVYEKFIKD